MDLAKGHIAALRKLKEQCGCRVGREGKLGGVAGRESWVDAAQSSGVQPLPQTLFSWQIYNLGTGTGYSVLQMVQAMEKASGKKVSPILPGPISHRRPSPSHSPAQHTRPRPSQLASRPALGTYEWH